MDARLASMDYTYKKIQQYRINIHKRTQKLAVRPEQQTILIQITHSSSNKTPQLTPSFSLKTQIINLKLMGNKQTASLDIQYIRSIEDPNFGQVELFRQSDIELIMKKTFTFVSTDPHSETLKRQLYFMHDNKHASLAPSTISLSQKVINLLGYHHSKLRVLEKHLCIEYEKIQAYVEYYNYTFANILEKGGLDINELWYALNSLSDVGAFLHNNNLASDEFTPQHIFLSLKGVPCLYLFDPPVMYSFDSEKPHPVRSLALTILSMASCQRIQDSPEAYQPLLDSLAKRSKQLAELLTLMLNHDYSFQKVLEVIDELINKDQVKLAKSLKITKFKALIPHTNHNLVASTPSTAPVIPESNNHRVVAKQQSTTSLNTTADRVQKLTMIGGIHHHSHSSSKSFSKGREQGISIMHREPLLGIGLSNPFSSNNDLTSRHTLDALKQQLDQRKSHNQEQRQRMRTRMQTLLGKQNKIPTMQNSNNNNNSIKSSADNQSMNHSTTKEEQGGRTGTSQKKGQKGGVSSSMQRPPKHITNISWSRRVAAGSKKVYI